MPHESRTLPVITGAEIMRPGVELIGQNANGPFRLNTADLAQNAPLFDGSNMRETWADLFTETVAAGKGYWVPDSDGGTHTDPITSEAVANAGIYIGVEGGPTGYKRVADNITTSANQAISNAQQWAENGEDVEIANNPGSYSAKHWSEKAQAVASLSHQDRNDVWSAPRNWPNTYQVPSSGFLPTTTQITIVDGGRIFRRVAFGAYPAGLQSVGAGDAFEMTFKLLSGAAPTTMQFATRDGSTVVQTVVFESVGDGYYTARTVIDASCDDLQLDIRNASGSDLVISRLTYRFINGDAPLADQHGLVLDRLRASEADSLGNNFDSSFTVGIVGSGDAPENDNGVLVVKSGTLAHAIVNTSLSAGQTYTVRAFVEEGEPYEMNVFLQGSTSSNHYLDDMGGGWWMGTFTSPLGIGDVTQIRVQADNRDMGFGAPPDCRIRHISWVEGEKASGQLSGSFGAQTDGSFPISWEKDGDVLYVYALNETRDLVCRYTFKKQFDLANDLDALTPEDWSLGVISGGTWTLTKDLTPESEISTAMQTQQAIDETTSPDIFIWGGKAHGQTTHEVKNVIVDGVAYDFDSLPATGIVSGDSFAIHCRGYANDEGTSTEALKGSTVHIITHGAWDKIDEVVFSKTNEVGPFYPGMAPTVNDGFGQFTIDDDTYNVATTSGDVYGTASKNPMISFVGNAGRVTIEAIKHSGLISTLVTDRDTAPVPFRKAYMVAGTTAKVTVNAGDRRFLHSRYTHSSHGALSS